MSGKKLAQIFAGIPLFVKTSQQALDSVRHFRGGTTVTHRPRNRGKLAHRATNAEVISIDHLAAHYAVYKRLRYFEISQVADSKRLGSAALPRWRADPDSE